MPTDAQLGPMWCLFFVLSGQKRYVKKHVRHECFLDVLKNTAKTTTAKFRTFVSSNQTVRTVEITKVCLSAMDDKRYVLDDGLHTLAYGHKKLRQSL